ncbi:MAG: hypothetical protein JSW67_03895, partial [Candidatus Latescibacterota bacterium]
MFTKVNTKSLLAIAIIATITASSGCRTLVTGPEVQEATPEKAIPVPGFPPAEDLTGDGYVDASDLSYFAYAVSQGDVTLDGKVNAADKARMDWAMGKAYPADLEGQDASVVSRAAFLIPCDFDNNQIIDASDLAFFATLMVMC